MRINLQNTDLRWKPWLAAGFRTPRIHARPLVTEDLGCLRHMLEDRRVYLFLEELSDAREGLSWFDHVLGKRNHAFLTICHRTADAVMGLLVFRSCSGASLRFGGFIGRDHENQGFASETLEGLIGHLRSVSFPVPLRADVHAGHGRVLRLLEKNGFIRDRSSRNPERLEYLLPGQ